MARLVAKNGAFKIHILQQDLETWEMRYIERENGHECPYAYLDYSN